MPELLDWERRFGDRTLAEHAARSPSALMDFTPPAPGVDLTVRATARVCTGRWIADCPWCAGAEFVNFTDPLFFCCGCRNATVDNHPIRVEVPVEKLRGQVAAYLTARPNPANMNWKPDETVKDLRDENRLHGVRLP